MGHRPLVRFVVALLMFLPLAAHGMAGDEDAETLEKEAIARVVDQYVEGGRQGNSAIMKKAFHEGATIYFAGGGGPIQFLFDRVDELPPQPDIPYALSHIEVFRDIAMARMEIMDWGGARYTDMLTFVKTGGGWKIVNKMTHRHPAPPKDE